MEREGGVMAELTEQQIDLAARASSACVSKLGYPARLAYATEEENKAMAHEAMRAAAPFLQLPWDEPTEEESYFCSDVVQANEPQDVIGEFVRRRNAAILTKPVDPRRERIRSVLVNLFASVDPQKIARDFGSARELQRMLDEAETKMLAALDGVK
jgi:hypothetical protein